MWAMFTTFAQSSMTVNLVGGALVAFGVALFVVTISFWRSAPADSEVLAPLEVMEDRDFARADPQERVNLLNKFRPRGASRITRIQAPPQLLRAPETDPVDEFDDDYDPSLDTGHDDEQPSVPSVIDPLLRSTQSANSSHATRPRGDDRSPRRR